MPKISVIVPVYNVEKYLNRCIDSILNQTFEDFELILVDDGSTDKSLKICDEYKIKDGRIKVIHKKNGGVSSARNTGIDKATGEYITFVDSDDYISNDTLNILLDSNYQDSDLVISSLEMKSYDGKRTVYDMNEKIYATNTGILEEYISWEFPQICFCGPCAKRYNREIIKKMNIKFREDMALGEDTYFNLQYLMNCKKIASTDRITYFYIRDNAESLFSKFQSTTYEQTKIVHEYTLECAKKLYCSDRVIEKEIKNYISILFGNLIKSINCNNKDVYLNYAMSMSEDSCLVNGMHLINKNHKQKFIAKIILKKKFNIFYNLYKVYKTLKVKK